MCCAACCASSTRAVRLTYARGKQSSRLRANGSAIARRNSAERSMSLFASRRSHPTQSTVTLRTRHRPNPDAVRADPVGRSNFCIRRAPVVRRNSIRAKLHEDLMIVFALAQASECCAWAPQPTICEQLLAEVVRRNRFSAASCARDRIADAISAPRSACDLKEGAEQVRACPGESFATAASDPARRSLIGQKTAQTGRDRLLRTTAQESVR